MRTVRRCLSLILAVLMLASLAPEPAAAVDTVYFTAVNDTLLDLNDETMPFWSGGVLYVAYTAFDGTDLGIFYARSRDKLTVVLYNQRYGALVCDFAAGTIYDNSSKQVFSGAALTRNDVVFLPLDAVCRFFNLDYSYTRISYGYLVRIKSDSVVLSDATFIDAASAPMAQRYTRYERAHTSEDIGSGSAPANSGPEPAAERTVYLAVESTDAAYSAQVLSTLSASRAAFLFAPQSLEGADDLLRRLAVTGCAMALRIDASEGAKRALESIEEANRALWEAATVKTRLVRLENASEETAAAVAEAGYCPLRFALDFGGGGVPVSRMSSRILAAADANGGSCCVFLGTDETASSDLSPLLAGLRSGNCTPARLNEVIAS